MAAFSLSNKVRWTHHGPAAAVSPRREALTIVQLEDERGQRLGCEPEELARILQGSPCHPHLDSGRFVGTNSFLAAALWLEFLGVTDLTHRGPPPTAGLLQGSGCSPADFGGKGRGPSVLPDRLPEGGAHPSLRQDATQTGGARLGLRASDQPGTAVRPARPHLPLPGNPGAAPPSPRARSPGPGPHTAMAQPETGPSTSSGRIQARAGLWAGRESCGFRLPASGLKVSWEWGGSEDPPCWARCRGGRWWSQPQFCPCAQRRRPGRRRPEV